jgi:hypothetical protein
MSEVKVNKISPRTACGTVTLGDSGDTFTIPSGATITNNGTASGFGATGAVNWNTTPVTASPLTGASGVGYFLNTTGNTITVNLPAGSAGNIISFADYAENWQTNNVSVVPNGTDKIGGTNASATLSTQGQSVTFVFVDSTQGWVNTNDSTSNVRGNAYIVATGGTVVDCGNFRTHIFTGPGALCVSGTAVSAPDNTVDYLVVAGGGGGSTCYGGGGGAGGFRLSNALALPAPSMSPLANGTGITAAVQSYPITVSAGGSTSTNGGVSTFSSITSAGGGQGGLTGPSLNGGSGGGGFGTESPSGSQAGGTGNTPPVSPSQGNNGGSGNNTSGAYNRHGGGGGGASTVGGNGAASTPGNGGSGTNVAPAFFGPTAPTYGTTGPAAYRYFAGGGGGGYDSRGASGVASGGFGGGGQSAPCAVAGTVNTGGGGGGGVYPSPNGAAGGSGIVIIRYKFQ